jgi:ParB family chromosome partitioning protein
MAAKKRGLGRGLDALLASAAVNTVPSVSSDSAEPAAVDGLLKEIPIEFLQRGKYQPRKDMDQDALEELAGSIKAQGVMQPIVVRPVSGPGDKKYEIIAGERRWRACQLAGLDKVPVLIRDVPDDAAMAMSLIENIQREDLNPIEEAVALLRLQQEFGLTQQEVADAVGKSRSTVTNLMRLMVLKEDVRRLLEHGDIEMGHARALLGLSENQQSGAAQIVVSKGFSVRQTEALVRKMLIEKDTSVSASEHGDADIRQLQERLSQRLGAAVAIQHGAKGKGKLVIKYNNLDELDGILLQIEKG